MGKILSFAKKYWYLMVTILALLLVQALCELTLPQYTANIVDVGIQNKGVESVVPEVIDKETFAGIMMFSNDEDKNIIEKVYKYKEEKDLSESEKSELKDTYTKLDFGGFYKLDYDEKDEDLKERIEDAMLSGEIALMKTVSKEMGGVEITDETQELMGETLGIAFVQMLYGNLGVDMEKHQMDYLKSAGISMIGLAFLGMVAAILVGLVSALLSAKTGRDLRNRMFNKVVSFSNEEMNNFSTASLITRCTNDIQQIQMVMVLLFRMVAYAPIMAIGGIIKVINSNTYMAWIIAVAVLAMFVLVGVLMVVAMPKFKVLQTMVDKLNLITREMLTGLPVIRAFSREKHEEKRFDGANQDLMKTQLFTSKAMAFMMPTMMLIMNAITVLIIWIGAKGIDLGNIQVGDMMAFITYTVQIVMSFLMISMVSIILPRASVAAERINQVLTSKTIITDPELPKKLESPKGRVEFENVNFRYPNAKEDVLSNISFVANPGETTAIIGSTGSGKSTMVQLIPRLYDVSEGRILIDGTDIREQKLHDIRDMIGYIPQKGILFSGTIESNIKFGAEDISEEEMIEAAKTAQASEFIEEKPDKYESAVSQGGTNVSGGQKQRLAIARAIAKRPQIYIFDDSFSALDYKTDRALRNALEDKVGDSTVIIVAQRISTIKNAQKIIVLDDGQIAGIGTHKELLLNNEVYQQIAFSQFSKAELEKEGLVK